MKRATTYSLLPTILSQFTGEMCAAAENCKTDGQTDTSTMAKTREALHAVYNVLCLVFN